MKTRAILDDDGNDIFKDDNKKPDVFTIYASRLKGTEEPALDDVAAQAEDFVLKANPGYEISQMFIDTKSSDSEIITSITVEASSEISLQELHLKQGGELVHRYTK